MKDVVFFLHRVYPTRKSKMDDLTLSTFEKALKLIRTHFKIVPLEAILEEKDKKPRCAITFDDGYADNFVYAYPILKKMGVPAHIFVSSGRILKSGVRKTLLDYWKGKVAENELFSPTSMAEAHEEFLKKGKSSEFLSWEEMEKMKDIFTFGAHGKDHLSFPNDERIVDFYDGTNPKWTMYIYGGSEPFVGLPFFPTRSELDVRKFFPSKELLEFCKTFPKEGNWKSALRKEIGKSFRRLGYFETKEEAKKRIENILVSSKKEIEKKLGIEVNTFAWPFGHYSEFSKKIAGNIYKYIFTVKKGFIDETEDPKELPRVSLGKDIFTVLGRLFTFSTKIGYKVYKVFKRGKVL
ncbi:MAG: polysaccharide deacetylase family protein [Desulfurobacteriaceae bacterium]